MAENLDKAGKAIQSLLQYDQEKSKCLLIMFSLQWYNFIFYTTFAFQCIELKLFSFTFQKPIADINKLHHRLTKVKSQYGS